MSKFLSYFQGYRKWSIMILSLSIGITFLSNGLLSGAEFVDLIKGIGIAFMSANAFEHIKGMVTNKKENKED